MTTCHGIALQQQCQLPVSKLPRFTCTLPSGFRHFESLATGTPSHTLSERLTWRRNRSVLFHASSKPSCCCTRACDAGCPESRSRSTSQLNSNCQPSQELRILDVVQVSFASRKLRPVYVCVRFRRASLSWNRTATNTRRGRKRERKRKRARSRE